MDREQFKKIISQLESSGGKNLEHPEIQSGIHEGTKAFGEFALMPATAKEFARRINMNDIKNMEPNEVNKYLESNPDKEEKLINAAMDYVLKKQNDPLKAAYSWNMGHNLKPEQIEQRNYLENPYVKKFQNEMQKQFINEQNDLINTEDKNKFQSIVKLLNRG